MELLRKEHITEKYVIVAPKDGRLKYLSRGYFRKHDFDYTIKLNGAMQYDTKELAEKALERTGIDGMVAKIRKTIELVEVESK